MATKDNVQGVVLALFGASAGGHLAALTADATAHGLTATAGNLAASAGFILGKDLTTNAAFRDNMLTGLGIPSTNSAYAAAAEWANGELAKTNANRGEIVATAVAYLAGLTDTASPFYAAAAAYRATVTAAVAWSEGAGATVFGVAELQAQQGTSGGAGETFTFTSSTEDVLEGGSGDDTFQGTSTQISETDSVDGGEGVDSLNITVKGNVAALTVDNVEEINLDLQAFAAATVDMTNVNADAVVNVTQSQAGYAKTVTLTEGGANEYVIGAGVTGLTFSNYEGGNITTGSSTSAITLTQSTAEVNIDVTANTVALTDTATAGTVLAGSIAAGATLDLSSATALESVDLTGTGTLRGTGANFEAASINAEGITLRVDGAATGNKMDLANIDVASIYIDTATLGFENAEGATFNLKLDSTFTADTSTDGGSYTVELNVDELASITTAASTTSAADEINHTGATININATSTINDVDLITAGGDTTINVKGGKFTFDALAEANTSAVITLNGDQAITVTSAANSTIDASAYTGVITLTNQHTKEASITTGSAADVVTVGATSKDDSQYYTLGDGNDTLDATLFVGAAGVGLFADLGSGDDKFSVSGTSGFAANATFVVNGGEGTDTLYLKADADVDYSAGNMALSGIEVISIATANTYTFDASTLSGQAGLAINATSAAAEDIAVVTADTDTKLDMSGITVTNLDSLVVTLTATKASSAFTGVLTNADETIAGTKTGVYGFNLNLGAGDDTITLGVDVANGVGNGGVLTLGEGNDTVIFTEDSTKSASLQLVNITDFNSTYDKIDALGNLGADVKAGASVDVSAATSVTTDSIAAYVKDGVIKLLGTDAANIDTLAEWVAVAGIVADPLGAGAVGTAGTYGFELNGNTYITSVDATGVELSTIELTGVIGLGLAAGGGTGFITVV